MLNVPNCDILILLSQIGGIIINNINPKQKFESYNINKYDIEIANTFMDCRIFWARVVSSENESLFTKYTKHTFYEIQYALDGHIGMYLGQGDYQRVAESDFVVIPPDTYHQVVDADSRGARFIMAFSIVIKDKKMNHILRSLNTVHPCNETPHMRALLSLILQKNYKNNTVCRRIITALLESFLLEVFEAFKANIDTSPTLPDKTDENAYLVCRMQNFIHSRNGIGITVTDLARQFNISERHVHRLFNSTVGKSPREVIQYEKLKKIEEYIVSTTLSLTEISELCGFCDEYAMNKFFKRYNLTNLTDFRRLAKKEQ